MPVWVRAGNIGERLCEVRDALGMTQGQFGALMGVTDQTVSDYETGRSAPGKARLVRLADDLQLPVAVFTEGGPMPRTLPIRPPQPRSGGEAPPGALAAQADLARVSAKLAFLLEQIATYRRLGAVADDQTLQEWERRAKGDG